MSAILDALGIKIGPPLSRRQLREIDRQEREWNAEVDAYMKSHGVDYDTAFVACGGTIYSDEDLKRMMVDALLRKEPG